MKRGRPVQTDGLRTKIKEALKAHPSTPDTLARATGATRNAVDGALLRMSKSGEIKKLGRGLYALP